MRIRTTALIFSLIGLAATTAQATVSIDLEVVGGTAVAGGGACEGDLHCVSASDGDSVVLEIKTVLESGDATVLVNPAFTWDAEAGALVGADVEGGSSEVASQNVNGVALTPLGPPGVDIREVAPGFADGWELQTLVTEGAPGPATFSLGTIVLDLTGQPTTIRIDESIGIPFGTSVGGAGFVDISNLVDYAEIRIVPEPASAAATLAVLASLGVLASRRQQRA